MLPQDGWTLHTFELDGTNWRFIGQYYGNLNGTPNLGAGAVDTLTPQAIAEAYFAVGAFYVSVSGTMKTTVGSNIISRNSAYVIGESQAPSYIPPVPGGPIQSITLGGLSNTTMTVNQLAQLTATINYQNGAVDYSSDAGGTWTSNAPNIVRVDTWGIIEAMESGGPVTITYTAPDGVTTATMQLIVS